MLKQENIDKPGTVSKTLVFDFSNTIAIMSESIKDKVRLLKSEILDVYASVDLSVSHRISSITANPMILIT